MSMQAIRVIPHTELVALAAELFHQDGVLCFQAGGRSMYPLIRRGDTLAVGPIGDRPVGIGEVVLYWSGPSRVAAHRVVGMEPLPSGVLRIRGDYFRAPMEHVARDRLVGRVLAVKRDGRWGRLGGRRDRAMVALWGIPRWWLNRGDALIRPIQRMVSVVVVGNAA